HFKTLISSVVEKPDSRIVDLDIIPEDERNLLLNVFNDTKTDYPSDRTIIGLFEEQVGKTPDNMAVVFEDVQLSYRELNGKANAVGNYLIDNYDIKAGDLVATMLGRSEKMIIALLGILKSGAAFVPIDPDYPLDRIGYMREDSDPVIILGDECGDGIIDINEILSVEKNMENPVTCIKPENLAYVIYTSGSTGKPKGTLVGHSGFINMSLSQINGFGILGSDRILQFASTSFDASLSEIFMALFSGGSLFVIGNESRGDTNRLQDYIRGNKISVATLPPAIMGTVGREFISTLRVLVTAGEKPSQSNIDYFARELNYINAYGPTEASVCVSYYPISPEDDNSVVPIGKPIPNTTLYILDDSSNLSPLGVPGELCVSGVGLAKGYLNRPELTD
ncbi:MAG: amino acid adenylation domain-containing protein, partial [bacterium]|nr:amino acid adenylation domain-containing protein [bacterium]